MSPVSGMSTGTSTRRTSGPLWPLARSGARAHASALAGTMVVLALAGALLSGTGVLVESGLRSGSGTGDPGLLIALATSFAGTALVLVVLVVASTVSLALRQRQRDFALLRAVGATRSQVRRLVAAEVSLVTLVAVPLGAVPGLFATRWLTPLLVEAQVVAPDFTVTLSPLPVVAAVLVLLPLARLVARLASRETLRTPPTTAVRQSTVEPAGIGPVRRVAALTVGIAGLLAAFSPVLVPGSIGSAASATSAFLLVGAAALAGPLLVAWVLGSTRRFRGGPATVLALANTRGFSRRLTTAVVPLALVLAVGTVQSTVDEAVVQAAQRQLTEGMRADLVVTAPDGDGIDQARLDELSALAGAGSTTPLGLVPAQVQVDDELGDVRAFEALAWESTQVRTLPSPDPGSTASSSALDPEVSDGDLAALDRPGTIALSRDAVLDTGTGVGDSLLVRWDGGAEHEVEVVAVYERGLGFGAFLTSEATPAAQGVEATIDTVLVQTVLVQGGPTTTDGSTVREELAGLGLTVTGEAEYVAAATAGAGADRTLSSVLTLLLLLFVGVAAANTLVLTTAGRRAELALLGRTGATRRQLVAMAGVEALVAGVAACAIGAAAVTPAVLGVGFGLLGVGVPPVDAVTLAGLAGAVLAVPLLTVVPAVARSVRWERATGAGSV
ncbi:FtsX-like permease family protein [Nocardioides campestrisoli]|uniref:FtsX-like permease family protein n=1 Tax=Nocardioides campestrisoli TaxID=2736757 RepID=UPI0015E7747D|nr:ABC transporter permease [Nocardioides campestrisoli]